MNGIHAGVDERTYHRDAALGSTEARILLEDGGPARYRYAKDNPPLVEPSSKFDIGSAVHTKVLGAGASLVVVEASDWRTKAAQQARDEARQAGRLPLLTAEFELVNAAAESVLANRTARAVLEQPGTPEASVWGTDPDTGVQMRARYDFLPDLTLARPIAADLKTTAGKASPDEFGRSATSYKYFFQQTWYEHTLANSGAEGNTPRFVFLVCEKTPPYLVGVFELPTVLLERGRELGKRSRETFARCLETDVWPGITNDVRFVDVPNWFAYEEVSA